MTRETKFRAWDTETKKFIYSDWKYGVVSFWDNISNDFTAQYKFPQQYTGLKDKNGKEIYEGDIVSYRYEDSSFVTKVECQRGMFCYDPKEGQGANHALILLMNYQPYIIGNIYENPELINKEK